MIVGLANMKIGYLHRAKLRERIGHALDHTAFEIESGSLV